MDPLTAFGLAANVVSFVSFASDLIKTSSEIYLSRSGSTGSVVSLDHVYTSLSELSSKLQSTYQYRFADESIQVGPTDVVKEAAVAVRALGGECKKDCDELLSVTERLRLKDGNDFRRKWESFRIALRKSWEQKKIDEIEDRLLKTQTVLTLHICTISATYQERGFEQYEKLRAWSKTLQINQDAMLNEINSNLLYLEQVIRDSARIEGTKPFEKADVESLNHQFEQLSISQDLVSKEQRLLSTLRFRERPLRHDAISEAHEKTFRWLLDDYATEGRSPTASRSRANVDDKTTLARWLESQNGIFWVSGKPGCGKSTLMKFIASESRTHAILSRWASPVIVAAHYFWSSGSPMQKSQEGLLRTLLYEIFRQHPELIPVICKERWLQLGNSNDASDHWSLSSLSEALGQISENTEIQHNFCFFIDGLDEFDGNHDGHFQLCQTMCKLSESPHVKICLSSRPWNVFEEAFGRKPKIYVHDLTWNDIRNFASSRLEEHPRWSEITMSFNGQLLIDEIANRSWGVFLWVFLVTKLLREGMTNRDRIPDLRRRLESFPSELDDFFKQILNSVEPIYYVKTATILQIALSAKGPLDMFIYDFHDLEHDDEDYFSCSPRLPFTVEEVGEVFDRMTYHLNSRTRGLLELASPSAPVTFLHRTVKDYLTTKTLADFIQHNLPKYPDRGFIPELSILRAYAAWIKRATPEVLDRKTWGYYYSGTEIKQTPDAPKWSIPDLTERLMPYAAQLDAQGYLGPSLAKVLDDIDSNVAAMFSSARTSRGLTNKWAWNPKLFFREHLADASVFNYVLAKEAKDPVFASDDMSKRRLRDCKQAVKSRPSNRQLKMFSGSSTVVTKISPTKRRKPPNSFHITPKARVRAANKPERDTREEPAKKRRKR